MLARHLLAGALTGALTIASATPAAPIVHEGFDYPAGAIDGSQTGGTGMSGAWSTTPTDSGTPYSMVGGGLTFSNLLTTGSVSAKRASASGGAEMSRPISNASQTALTGDNTTIWFSVLINTIRFSAGNENGTFVLATAPLNENDTDKILPRFEIAGEACGVHVNGNNAGSPFYIHAYAVDDNVAAKSTGYLDTGTTEGIYLIAGNIEWAPNGSDDTLRLFNITDAAAAEPADGAAFATITADLDQSQFDTLAIANRQVSSLDEIRFAATFEEVMGREPAAPGAGSLIYGK